MADFGDWALEVTGEERQTQSRRVRGPANRVPAAIGCYNLTDPGSVWDWVESMRFGAAFYSPHPTAMGHMAGAQHVPGEGGVA